MVNLTQRGPRLSKQASSEVLIVSLVMVRGSGTYDLVSVFSPESSEGIDIGSHTDEVGASTTRNELGRNDL
jgi:hypothetical protein